ncbi:MAG: hypothetical protein OXL34_12790 [Gemmatimonadota bacterium]|nr:hypothetical protein [Gemmatimonadota bacterium]
MIRCSHVTIVLVFGILLGHAGEVHAQRPTIVRPPQKSPEERYEELKKSPLLAATLEWIVPTVGHDYAGDREAGMLAARVTIAGAVLFIGGALIGFSKCQELPDEPPPGPNCGRAWGVVAITGFLTVPASRIWASVSAWRLANRTNAYYRRSLRLDDADLALSVTPAGQLGLGVSLRF